MQFLRHRPDHFVLGYAVGGGLAMATIDEDGTVTTGPAVPIDTSGGKPSELGWLALFPDDRMVFATNFGYSYVTSYRIDGTCCRSPRTGVLEVPGDGTLHGLAEPRSGWGSRRAPAPC